MLPAQVGNLNNKEVMDSIKNSIAMGANGIAVEPTGEGKSTDVETTKFFSPSRPFTAEDAGVFRLTDVEMSKVSPKCVNCNRVWTL